MVLRYGDCSERVCARPLVDGQYAARSTKGFGDRRPPQQPNSLIVRRVVARECRSGELTALFSNWLKQSPLRPKVAIDFMRMKIRTAILIALALYSEAGSAAYGQRPRAFSINELGFLLGSWKGEGTFATGKPVASLLEFKSYSDGQVVEVREQESPPNAFAYLGSITLDSVKGSMVMLMAGNNTGGARLFRSDGWVGQQIIFRTDPALHAWFGFERLTFTRLDDDHFSASYELSRNGDNWTVGDRQTYTRERGASLTNEDTMFWTHQDFWNTRRV
jgi:hypothetical protein